MLNPKLKHFFKTYFHYSQTERRGVLWLIALVLLAACIPHVYSLFVQNQSPAFVIIGESNFENSDLNESITIKKKDSYTSSNTLTLPDSFSIDPNVATASQWKLLGLSNNQVVSIEKYLKSGGKFKHPDDLNKIRVLNKYQVTQIKPYLKISQTTDKSIEPPNAGLSAKKKSLRYPIDVNSADSITLTLIKGIGPATASKIIHHRERLGGFMHLHQLTEIWGFDEDRLYDLKDKIVVDTHHVRKIRINHVSYDELSQHPYTKYKLSRVIINYRNQHGPFAQPNDLMKIAIMQDSTLEKLRPYLIFE